MTHDQMMNTFLILMVCLFIFAVIREIVCWYFKINKRVLLQEKSIKNQERIIELIMYQQGLDKFDRVCASGGQPDGIGGGGE
mgnify:CR=1 FL=1